MPTQVERSSATREKTIAATIDCLVEHGYSGTTISAITARGLSRGAIAHHYPDKLSLITDVISEINRRVLLETASVLESVPPGRRRIEAGLNALWQIFKSPSTAAAFEVFMAGRTDAALHARVVQVYGEINEAYLEVIRAMVGGDRAGGELDVQADVVVNTVRGLAFLHTCGIPPETVERTWARARSNATEILARIAPDQPR